MIVSDASPLIVLLKTNNIIILKDLFQQITIPQAVYKEITAKKQEKSLFDKIDWIKIRKIKNADMASFIEKLLDKGETEAIILAKELQTKLLIDDAKARKYAKMLDIEVIGTLGLLKMAKTHGIIISVRGVISKMLDEGYYINDELIKSLLIDVGET